MAEQQWQFVRGRVINFDFQSIDQSIDQSFDASIYKNSKSINVRVVCISAAPKKYNNKCTTAQHWYSWKLDGRSKLENVYVVFHVDYMDALVWERGGWTRAKEPVAYPIHRQIVCTSIITVQCSCENRTVPRIVHMQIIKKRVLSTGTTYLIQRIDAELLEILNRVSYTHNQIYICMLHTHSVHKRNMATICSGERIVHVP